MAEKDDVIQELTTRWAVAHEGTVPPHVYILKWNGEKNPDDVLVGGVKAENFTYDDQIVGAVMGRETKTLGIFARVAVFGGPERNEQVMAIAQQRKNLKPGSVPALRRSSTISTPRRPEFHNIVYSRGFSPLHLMPAAISWKA